MVVSRSKKDKNAKANNEPVIQPLTNVEKQFFELQIADLNRKLVVLKKQNETIEAENEELQKKIQEMADDRQNATIHINRVLEDKIEQIKELESKILVIQKNYEDDLKNFKIKIREKDEDFKMMEMDIKLLTAKCDSLVDFRDQKEAYKEKYELQEKEKIEQEKRHKKALYELERKLVIDKERFRQDVDQKLLELSNEFTMKNEIRVAASTQRLVRENISMNSEMDKLMFTVERLQKENNELKGKFKEIFGNFETHMDEKKRLIKTGQQQYQIIKNLTDEIEKLKITSSKKEKENAILIQKNFHEELNENHKKIKNLEKINLQLLSDLENCKLTLSRYQKESEKLSQTIKKLNFHIKSVIRGDTVDDDLAFREYQRKNLLKNLLNVIEESKNDFETFSFNELALPTLQIEPSTNSEGNKSKSSLASLKSLSKSFVEVPEEEITLFDVQSGSYEFSIVSQDESEINEERKTLTSMMWDIRNSKRDE